MRPQREILADRRVLCVSQAVDGGKGYVDLGKGIGRGACVVWSFGGGWDHVSISFTDHDPTWRDMCAAKEIFFDPEEVCVEYHPRASEYVNIHQHCLHIWRPQHDALPTPPKIYV
jgi:hypothetical protein